MSGTPTLAILLILSTQPAPAEASVALPCNSALVGAVPPFHTITANGGWCWFQDPRALLDGDILPVGSVKSPEGDVDLHIVSLPGWEVRTVTLHRGLDSDDHAAPAVLKLPDGRYLVAYSTHGRDRLMRWRLSKRCDPLTWGPEQTIDVGAACTYANLLLLRTESNRIYNFHRGIGFDPNYLVSDDLGRTFRYGGRLFDWPVPDPNSDPRAAGGPGAGRPYAKYACDRAGRIHIAATDDHPRNYANSIYHGYVQNGWVHRSDGKQIQELSRSSETSLQPRHLSLVFEGSSESIAWINDLELDVDGRPTLTFSVRKDARGAQHDHYWAGWNGSTWVVERIAHAGACLYPQERDYTGLASLLPGQPEIVAISTNVHPETGAPLISKATGRPQWELFLARRPPAGGQWRWQPVTQHSTSDNLRPILLERTNDRAVLLWLRGRYRTYRDYDLHVVGVEISLTDLRPTTGS